MRLLSRASAPSVAIGPFVDDRRMLGVAVAKVVLWNSLDDTEIPASGLNFEGWHANEGNGRWTNGNAVLDLPVAGTETYLDVHVLAAATYVVEGQTESVMACAA